MPLCRRVSMAGFLPCVRTELATAADLCFIPADIRLVACVGSIKVLEKLCRTSSGFKQFEFQGGGVRDSGTQSFNVQG